MKDALIDAANQLLIFAKALVPGALGAAVAVAIQQGLTWFQRFIQLVVGIIVSYYAGEAAASLFEAEDVVKNAIGFVSGLAAFETSKALRTSTAEVAQTAPREVWQLVLGMWERWFNSKK